MRKLLATFWLATICLSASASQATPTDNTETAWTGAVTIGAYTPGNSAYTYVGLRSGASFVTCPSGDFRISTAHPAQQQLHSAALAALLSGKSLTVGYQNVSGACWIKTIGFNPS